MSTSNGVTLRRIVYINPEDGVIYTHLTTDNTLPAYQIVLLYKHRWDIEKIFHQFKSKMVERKSWASSHEAKQSHAIFECLTHNLLLLLEEDIRQNEGLRDELEEQKQKGRSNAAAAVATAATGVVRGGRKLYQHRASESHPEDLALHPVGARLDLQTGSLARFHDAPEASLGINFGVVFYTDLPASRKRYRTNCQGNMPRTDLASATVSMARV